MAKHKTSLTFYGGVNEIGGNKILLQDGDVKVFFDFGMSFKMKRRYYSPPFLSPRTEKSLQELDILPKIEGIYKFDEKAPEVKAVFLSHGHMDHSAYLSFIKREIPVYCGETTKIILQASSEMRRTELEFNVEGIEFKTFRTGKKVVIDDVEIEPIHVDHSVPGAYGFIIHTSNGAIVYTGDFRIHGAKPQMTQEFVNKAKAAKPAAVITEATNMTGASVSSEAEVENKLNSIVEQANGIVLANFASTDVDRLNSFYRIAKKNKRCLAVSLKQAYLLEALRKDKGLKIPSLSEDNILIFRKSKKTKDKWESKIMEQYQDKIKNASDVSKQQCELILALSFYDLEELVEINPTAGSCYVLSASEPFNEEMELDYEKLVNWLGHYGLPQYHVHVSGHIMPLQLKAILKEINATKIFPVHTENAELLARFTSDLKSKTMLVEKEKKYEI
ncbi:MAG: MBL fold metallo-hydrolase [Candidatus Bathyarchaeota archaeon]|jgi:ribonuclease J|nr:MBL fold metallo-hydrolase [Candidatus Bathyarchaeota archaeon A05DMB-5]MDH7557944.1 MBL fold metallo-hydrolase [Candidatus Bathyarchaeota archaeon]